MSISQVLAPTLPQLPVHSVHVQFLWATSTAIISIGEPPVAASCQSILIAQEVGL
jgi:hypothetical protein